MSAVATNQCGALGLLAGVILADPITQCGPETQPALSERINALIAERATDSFPPAELKDSVRSMMKKGGFKPTGRNKPSSEYLCQAAREGRFPRVNNIVDINNLASTKWGLPMSVLDAESVGPSPVIRAGRPGESFVFNASGQSIDLKGLASVCRAADDVALGNPVKDSMQGKVTESTKSLFVVVWGTTVFGADRMRECLADYESLLREFAGVANCQCHVVA
eukprot:m51a1_g9360 hypothetical protein (222) ;mRNA; f:154342-155166